MSWWAQFSSAGCSLQSVLTISLLLYTQVFDDPKKKRNFMLIMGVTLGLFIIGVTSHLLPKAVLEVCSLEKQHCMGALAYADKPEMDC